MNGPFDAPFINQVSRIAPGPTPGVARAGRRPRVPDQDFDPKLARKRAKAAERQRNKRQRDRQRERDMQAGSSAQPNADAPFPGAQPPGPSGGTPIHSASGQLQDGHDDPPYVTEMKRADEERRNKVRAAARERQRKHRALVKQRKMQEMGIAIGEDGIQALHEVHFELRPDGQYQPVLPTVPHPPPEMNGVDPSQFPQGQHPQQTGGQTFASTLLLSFSCSPLLKQHLLRTLHMTNEELSSLEPILSAAWDQWDASRRAHYAEQAANANAEQNGAGINGAPPSNPFVPHPPPSLQDPNDFRTRFHRPLTAPSPFGATPLATASAAAPGSQIDPSLNNGAQSANGVLAQVVQAATAVAAAQAKQNGEKESEKASGSQVDGEGKSDGEGSVVDANAAT